MTTIKLKNGSGAPLAGDLVQAEPALDLTNKRLYTEDSGGTVIEVGTNPSTINIDAGTIDGTVIGGSTAAAGSFTTFTSTGIDDNAASTAITIDSSQNVGIGTSSPQRQLHVSKNANNTHIAIERDGTDNPSALILGANQNKTEIISSAAEESTSGVPLTFLTGNTERLRLDASGNLLVGKTAAGSDTVGFQVLSTGKIAATVSGDETARFNRTTSDGDIVEFRKDDTSVGSIGVLSSRLYIGSGDTGIKFSGADDLISPIDASDGTGRDAAIDLGSSGARFKDLYLSGQTFGGDGAANVPSYAFGNDTNMGMYRAGNNILGFSTSSAERVRIDGSGVVSIGDTGSGSASRLYVLGASTNSNIGVARFNTTGDDESSSCIAVVKNSGSTSTSNVFIRFGIANYNSGCGQINANGVSQAAFGSFSDRRLKENITDLPNQLASITALRPVEFDYIESEGGGHQIGFIAQEVEEIYPDLVGERHDGMKTLTGINKMEARLIKAIQEQNELINDLRARVAQLEGAN
jgi:hypothetical protein